MLMARHGQSSYDMLSVFDIGTFLVGALDTSTFLQVAIEPSPDVANSVEWRFGSFVGLLLSLEGSLSEVWPSACP